MAHTSTGKYGLLAEHYGDPHLHYEDIPEYQGTHSGSCKWNAQGQSPYDLYQSEKPLYPQRCHVEYCHPGTWQGSEGGAVPEFTGELEAPASKGLMDYLPFNLQTGGIVLLIIVLLYFFRKKIKLFK